MNNIKLEKLVEELNILSVEFNLKMDALNKLLNEIQIDFQNSGNTKSSSNKKFEALKLNSKLDKVEKLKIELKTLKNDIDMLLEKIDSEGQNTGFSSRELDKDEQDFEEEAAKELELEELEAELKKIKEQLIKLKNSMDSTMLPILDSLTKSLSSLNTNQIYNISTIFKKLDQELNNVNKLTNGVFNIQAPSLEDTRSKIKDKTNKNSMNNSIYQQPILE